MPSASASETSMLPPPRSARTQRYPPAHGQVDEARLLAARDDLDLHAGLPRRPVDEHAAVLALAHRRSGDGADVPDAELLHLAAERGESAHGGVDGPRGQPAAEEDAVA
jgi:hypothetical protein